MTAPRGEGREGRVALLKLLKCPRCLTRIGVIDGRFATHGPGPEGSTFCGRSGGRVDEHGLTHPGHAPLPRTEGE